MKCYIFIFLMVVFLNQPEAISQPAKDQTREPINFASDSYQVLSIKISYIDWINLQWPSTANIAAGASVNVYNGLESQEP